MRFSSLLLLCGLIGSSVATSAPDTTVKPYRIMMLLYRGQTEAEKGFMDYFKRRHIPVEFIVRDAQANTAKIPEFVAEAKDLKPDLIYTFGTTVTAAVAGLEGEADATRNITDIPIVFDIVADPVGARLIKSLKSSGRNLTGASHIVPLGAQLQALQAMRSTSSLGVIYNPNEPQSVLAVRELEKIAPAYSLTLHSVPLQVVGKNPPTADAIGPAMRELVARKPQFIYVPSDSFLIKNASRVVLAAHNAGIPVFAATEAPIRDDGALLGLVSTYANVGELAAHKAEQILSKRARPAQIPIESLNRFTYLINMKSAKSLGVYPPLSVLKFAELIAPADTIDARE
jgi:putative ABC transport system substrate-binding protein